MPTSLTNIRKSSRSGLVAQEFLALDDPIRPITFESASNQYICIVKPDKPFYQLVKSILPGSHKPTTTHHFIKALQDKGYHWNWKINIRILANKNFRKALEVLHAKYWWAWASSWNIRREACRGKYIIRGSRKSFESFESNPEDANEKF